MEPKSIPWEVVEDFGMEQYLCGMREQFTVKRAWTTAVLVDAEKDRQEGIQGDWQMASPFREELEIGKVKQRHEL